MYSNSAAVAAIPAVDAVDPAEPSRPVREKRRLPAPDPSASGPIRLTLVPRGAAASSALPAIKNKRRPAALPTVREADRSVDPVAGGAVMDGAGSVTGAVASRPCELTVEVAKVAAVVKSVKTAAAGKSVPAKKKVAGKARRRPAPLAADAGAIIDSSSANDVDEESAPVLDRLRAGWSGTRFAARGESTEWEAALAELAARQAAVSMAARLALAVEQREWIASRALRAEDWRVALSALDARDKLLGLSDGDVVADQSAAASLVGLAELAGRLDS